MSVFEYLGVLVSVVMGLGITHVLAGVSKTIHHRDTMKIYWVHLVWTVSLLIQILAIWWGMFWWSTLDDWQFFQFLFLALYAILLFLAAGMLYPWSIPEDFDFEHHYMYNRKWFFGILFTAWTVDIPETLYKAGTGLREAPALYLSYVGGLLCICLALAYSKNRWLHGILSIVWLASLIFYLGSTTLAQIAFRSA